MTENGLNNNGKFGIVGGTLTILFFNLHGDELVKTIVLAALGACVSYFVSWLIKFLIGKNR